MNPLASKNSQTAEAPPASDSIGKRMGLGLLPVAPNSRRRFLRRLSLGAALFTVPRAFAEQLARKTLWVEAGPFYPPNLPLDTHNDRILADDSITPPVR